MEITQHEITVAEIFKDYVNNGENGVKNFLVIKSFAGNIYNLEPINFFFVAVTLAKVNCQLVVENIFLSGLVQAVKVNAVNAEISIDIIAN